VVVFLVLVEAEPSLAEAEWYSCQCSCLFRVPPLRSTSRSWRFGLTVCAVLTDVALDAHCPDLVLTELIVAIGGFLTCANRILSIPVSDGCLPSTESKLARALVGLVVHVEGMITSVW
jgi:hypothetical protein